MSNKLKQRQSAAFICLFSTFLFSVFASGPGAVAGESEARVNIVASNSGRTADTTREAAEIASSGTGDPWGPVPTDYLSIANIAPGLLPFYNGGMPVFGLPGTMVGDFWSRTQVTGDWGGARTELARKGIFLDIYTTSTYQKVLSGGIKTGDAFVQNNQISLNIDTGRAGLWNGGLIHFTVQSRSGALNKDTFTVGSFVPQNLGLTLPNPETPNNIYPTEYYISQSFNKYFNLILGKVGDITFSDETLFGDNYQYYFANFNFNKNPLTSNTFGPSAWTAFGEFTLTDWLTIGVGIWDPFSKAQNFANNAFDKVNLIMVAVMNYSIYGLPGQFQPTVNWSNKPQIDRNNPFGKLSPEQIPQAIGALVGGSTDGLPVKFKEGTGWAIASLSQYLFVKDEPEVVAQKLKSGQPIRGIGVFGRVGWAPPETSAVASTASVALFANGLIDSRKHDAFGIGAYYNNIGNSTKNDISKLSENTIAIRDEWGMEVFYSFAVTPAIRVIPSYQHIRNPLIASVETGRRSADVFLARLNIIW